ncbi:MAG: hypothetical protein HIU90_07375 [Proteobacteria bacterium]|nr:hypothetical protein [Pseudomonadota bacterium]
MEIGGECHLPLLDFRAFGRQIRMGGLSNCTRVFRLELFDQGCRVNCGGFFSARLPLQLDQRGCWQGQQPFRVPGTQCGGAIDRGDFECADRFKRSCNRWDRLIGRTQGKQRFIG